MDNSGACPQFPSKKLRVAILAGMSAEDSPPQPLPSEDEHAKLSLDRLPREPEARDACLLELDDALERLTEMDARKARVVELRFFGGLDIEATAAALDVSHATVERDWAFARAWLARALETGE
jgi:RNA polymerase sigma factor (sigma-70 family)